MADSLHILSGATLLQALVFAGLIIANRDRNRIVHWILLALMLVYAVDKADQLFRLSGLAADHPRWAMIGNTFGTLVAPLVYLHVRVRTLSPANLTWNDLYVALPFAALVVYVISAYHILPFEQKAALYRDGTIATPVNQYVVPILWNLSNLGFLLAAINRINRHTTGAYGWFSDVEGRVFPGVRLALLLMAVLIGLHLVWIFWPAPGWRLMLNLGHFLLLNVLALSVFQSDKAADIPDLQKPRRNEKDGPELLVKQEEVDTVMREQALYLDPDLTLTVLAKALRRRPREVSETLNHGVGQNFYTYVNAWRIEEAKLLLRHEVSTPVLDIALRCGFNSKSAFNAAFKRLLGMTPTDWRRTQTS